MPLEGRKRRILGPRIVWTLVSGLLPMVLSAGEERPTWVDRFPTLPDSYIGLAHVSKRAHPHDFREVAQAAALAQISREISIQIKTVNAASQSENIMGWEDSFSQKTETASQNVLSGYQLAQVYETGSEFWALYTLDKEEFQKSQQQRLSAFSEWEKRELQMIKSDLTEGEIQRVVDRLANFKKRDSTFYAENIMRAEREASVQLLYTEVNDGIHLALHQMAWSREDEKWVYSLPLVPSSLSISPKIVLMDKITQKKWRGPITLEIREQKARQGLPCRMETDAQGKVNLEQAFVGCGLEAGLWEINWNSLQGGPKINIQVVLKPCELRLDFKTMGKPEMEKETQRIKNELVHLQGQRFRIAFEESAKPGSKLGSALQPMPNLQVRLQEIRYDSLEGIHFSSIRAKVIFPSHSMPYEIKGKSGHSEKERAFDGALRDFIQNLQVLP